ncbi:Hypothetical protein A7982_10663 [Minicystis rosea]|nr:Hypothetical protein A7982_10663 [Minicystis rosea]
MEATITPSIAKPIDSTGAESRTPTDDEARPSLDALAPAPRDRAAWGFLVGCIVIAALGFFITRWFASPVEPPDPPFFASSRDFVPSEPLGEAGVLPLPFVTRPIDVREFMAPSPPRGRVSAGAITIHGRVSPDVVKSILRRSHGRMRACYNAGLWQNPNLMGQVAVRFVIGRDGAVSNVGNAGTSLPDAGVVQCIVRALHGLSFPPPDAGIATIIHSMTLSPR